MTAAGTRTGAAPDPAADPVEVLVVGAGPAGMVAALGLAAWGVSVLLVDRAAAPHPHPKAHELSGRTLEIFEQLGVDTADLAERASPAADAARVVFAVTLPKAFGRVDLGEPAIAEKYRRHLVRPPLNIHQREVEEALEARVRATPGIELRRGVRWDGQETRTNDVLARLVDVGTGAVSHVRCRYVLAADGAASRVRQHLGIEMDGPDCLQAFASAAFEADLSSVAAERGKLFFLFSPDCPGAAFIAHHMASRWVCHFPVPAGADPAAHFPLPVLEARIRAGIGRPDVPFRITSTSTWRMSAQVARRFSHGRTFLVGDAAHRFPPTGGLGLNSGAADAHNLAWKLALHLRGRAPPSILDSYEQERRPAAETNCAVSRHNFVSMDEIVRAFGLSPDRHRATEQQLATGVLSRFPGWVRRLVRAAVGWIGRRALAAYDHDARVRARVDAAIAGQHAHFDRLGQDLGGRYARGAILPDGRPVPESSVSDYAPATAPGCRWPHFWLDPHHARSSHALLAYDRFTLLVGASPPDSPELRAACAAHGVRVGSLLDGVPPEEHARVLAHAGITPSGALLVRPDGHVAWRRVDAAVIDAAAVRALFLALLGPASASGAERSVPPMPAHPA